ncbi:MAG TPA: PH domain-containing protein [Steroidobacteraceae bacterium]|nr:PH domain-containing protein [Steroidobacteraceae bacterium]
MRFPSKVDGSLHAIAGASVLVALAALLLGPSHATRMLWIPVATVVLVAATVVWVSCSTYYELERDALVAHCGPFSWHVRFAEISSVRASRTTRSGPALSLDRLEIAYSRGRILVISPADQAGFLDALRRRVPSLAA